MIILDFEWNRGYDGKPLDEILQIGAVRLAGLGAPIDDTFNAYIRPAVHKSFDPGAKALPELAECRASNLDFPAALAAFTAWIGDETVFASWGGGDADTLARNCAHWSLPCPNLGQVHDLQRAFGHAAGAEGRQVALWRAVEYCGIPDCFSFHNALYDAVYTAVLSRWLTEEDLLWQPPKASARRLPALSRLAFQPQPRTRVGPFPTARAALSSRTARRAACPLCGRTLWVQEWYGPLGQRYYGRFRCPEHGRFLRRLTLSRLEDGQWRGRLALPPVTEALEREYQAAWSGKPLLCRGARRRRRRGRARAAALQSS